jgi:polar amino acid transport system substrate-binding protein
MVPSEEMNFKKIVAGRIDTYDTSKEVGYATIAKTLSPEEAKLITHHAKPVEQTEYFM